MNLQTLWSQLGPDGQAAVIGLLAGVVMWALQAAYTISPLPGLDPNTPNRRKRIIALLAVVVPAAIAAATTRDWTPVVVGAVLALASQQSSHRAAKALRKPEGTDGQDDAA